MSPRDDDLSPASQSGGHSDDAAGPSRPPSKGFTPSYGTMIRVLTATQNTSALVFSSFLVIHLASPLAAAVGGGSLADKTMMIARDAYLPLEPFLVYLPLGVHLASSLTKRALIVSRSKRPPPLTTHIAAGYLLPFFLVPHLFIHRLIPASPEPPISSLSPSELSFDFVSYSLRQYPLWSTLGYVGIVAVGVWHAGVGLMKITGWLRPKRLDMGLGTVQGAEGEQPRRIVPRSRKFGARGLLLAIVGAVSVGLVRLWSEGQGFSGIMLRRYRAVYASLPGPSLLR